MPKSARIQFGPTPAERRKQAAAIRKIQLQSARDLEDLAAQVRAGTARINELSVEHGHREFTSWNWPHFHHVMPTGGHVMTIRYSERVPAVPAAKGRKKGRNVEKSGKPAGTSRTGKTHGHA